MKGVTEYYWRSGVVFWKDRDGLALPLLVMGGFILLIAEWFTKS